VTQVQVSYAAFGLSVGLSESLSSQSETTEKKTMQETYTGPFSGVVFWQQVLSYKTDLGVLTYPTKNI